MAWQARRPGVAARVAPPAPLSVAAPQLCRTWRHACRKVYYCISAAIHSKIVRVRSVKNRRNREPPKRPGFGTFNRDQKPGGPPGAGGAPGGAPGGPPGAGPK
jgi:hypothetical protein